MSKVYRVYVEKRKDFAVEADEIFENLKTQLKLSNLEGVSVVNRYDVQGITKEVLDQGVDTILAEPMVDDVYLEFPIMVHSLYYADFYAVILWVGKLQLIYSIQEKFPQQKQGIFSLFAITQVLCLLSAM